MATPKVQSEEIHRIVDGQNVGSVTAGSIALTIGNIQCGVANIAQAGRRAPDRIRPCPRPPRILPRTVSGFLDRGEELARVGEALARGQVVDLNGPDGVGKTALITQAMRTQLAASFPAGLVYIRGTHETPEDILQKLFEAFYETDGSVKVSENDVRRYMAGKRALIAVDDVNHLGEREAETLAQAVPQCSVLIGGRKQQVWEGVGVLLRGLPSEQAIQLFAQHWGQVSAQEQATVQAICDALDNIPLSIIKTARTAAQQRLPLAEVLAQVRPQGEQRDPVGQAFRLVASRLSEPERRLLGGIAASGGETVSQEALAVTTGMSATEISSGLSRLQQLGLVHANSPRYSLDSGFRPYIRGAWASEGMRARAAEFYVRLAPRLRGQSQDPDERNVMAALGYYYRRGLWQQVVHIARSVDRYLATTGRWGQWRKRLNQAWQAARELGDRATEAWAQNQLGLIALALGDFAAAATFLKGALALWQALGDQAGMAITQWNLQILAIAPPPVKGKPGGKTTTGGGGSSLPIIFGAAAAVVVVVVTLLLSGGHGPPPTVAPPLTRIIPTTAVPTTVVPPELDLELAAGCDDSYSYPGGTLTILLHSSVNGTVDVSWVGPEGVTEFLFRQDVQGGRTATRNWEVPDTGGSWRLEADLNNGQASDQCRFEVDTGPEPQVQIWLEEGCDRAYQPGDTFTIRIHSNVEGSVIASWSDPANSRETLFEEQIQAAEIISRQWVVPDTAGSWLLSAALEGTLASSDCGFSVEIPQVEIELEDGCDRVYPACETPQLRLRASVDGEVNVDLLDAAGEHEPQFVERVFAGQDVAQSWEIPRVEGDWVLEADLNDGQATGRCGFSVLPESVQPVIEQVWIEPTTPDTSEQVCPGDMVWVYARLSDPCGDAPERVELRTRYPPGADEEFPVNMFTVDPWTYRGSLTAREAPGTLFYVYAEDAYGNAVQSDEQIYSVAQCEAPVVEFYPSSATVSLCGCTYVNWSVEGVREVNFEGHEVAFSSSERVCLGGPGTATYELGVVYLDGSSDEFKAFVTSDSQPSASLSTSVVEMFAPDCVTSGDYSDSPQVICQVEEGTSPNATERLCEGALTPPSDGIPSSQSIIQPPVASVCPSEIHVWYPDDDPYRCVAQQAIPQIIESSTTLTATLTQQIPTSDLSAILATRLVAGDIPNYLVLVYPDAVIDGLVPLFAEWPDNRKLYRWDQPSDRVVLQYPEPPTGTPQPY